MPKPQSPEHALFIGWALGTLMRGGLPVRPVLDADGDYTDAIELTVLVPPANIAGHEVTVTISLVVPPPDPDWRVGDQ